MKKDYVKCPLCEEEKTEFYKDTMSGDVFCEDCFQGGYSSKSDGTYRAHYSGGAYDEGVEVVSIDPVEIIVINKRTRREKRFLIDRNDLKKWLKEHTIYARQLKRNEYFFRGSGRDEIKNFFDSKFITEKTNGILLTLNEGDTLSRVKTSFTKSEFLKLLYEYFVKGKSFFKFLQNNVKDFSLENFEVKYNYLNGETMEFLFSYKREKILIYAINDNSLCETIIRGEFQNAEIKQLRKRMMIFINNYVRKKRDKVNV